MTTLTVVLSLCIVSMATAAMEGVSNSEDWAYQWYTGEPFRFKCQTSGLNFTDDNYVVWDTPTQKLINGTDENVGNGYQLMTADNIRGVELLIDNVRAEFHGVYTCYKHKYGSDNVEGKVIYGLNVHEVKYHDMMDKYRHNIVVAVIATAVFIGPFATICLVWQFQYEKRVDRKQWSRDGKSYVVDHEMKEGSLSDGTTATVVSREGNGAYDNIGLSTQL